MNYYLNRFSFREQIINDKPNTDLGIVVVIPCCKETDLLRSLKSLHDCNQPNCSVEVIVVINASENAGKSVVNQNEKTLIEAVSWQKENRNDYLNFFFIFLFLQIPFSIFFIKFIVIIFHRQSSGFILSRLLQQMRQLLIVIISTTNGCPNWEENL